MQFYGIEYAYGRRTKSDHVEKVLAFPTRIERDVWVNDPTATRDRDPIRATDLEVVRALRGGTLDDGPRFLHQLPNGEWVYAVWNHDAGQYHAPMTAREARLTGCYTYSARTLTGLGCSSYKTASACARAHGLTTGRADR